MATGFCYSKACLIHLPLYTPVFVIQKPVFMFYQHALSETCTFTDFLQVMLHGLKLDCTIAGYLTAIPLLLTLVSVWLPGAWLKKVLKGYFLIMGILVSAIFSVDVALYSFWDVSIINALTLIPRKIRSGFPAP